VPRLSLVICCPGHPAEFEDSLVSVLQNRPPHCEVLVLHAQPYDDPYALGDEVRFIRVPGRPSLTQLANRGLQAARGEIVHLLNCRLTVVEGWTDRALEKFTDEEVAAVSPLIISSTDKRVAAGGVNYGLGGSRHVAGLGLDQSSRKLSKLSVAAPSLEAGFYRRELLLAIGGWQEVLGDDAADVELAQRLQKLELRTAVAPECILHEARPAIRRAGFTRGRALERLFWQQHSESKSVLGLIAHVIAVATDALVRLPNGEALTTLVGRLVGLLHAGGKESYADQLAAAREALAALQDVEHGVSTLSITAAREELSQDAEKSSRRRAA
jgi:hypothetical protein